MKKSQILIGLFGALSLWIGFEADFRMYPWPVVFYPLSLAILGAKARGRLFALFQGGLVGILGATAGFYWISIPVQVIGGLHGWMGFLSALFLASYFGIFTSIFSFVSFEFRNVSIWKRSIVLGCAWYFLEWARGWFLTGLPWFPFVVSFSVYPVLLQGASLIGVYALSGVYVGILCLFFEGTIEAFVSKRSSRSWVPVWVSSSLFFAFILFGFIRISSHPLDTVDGVTVGVVQGNDEQITKWTPRTKNEAVNKYVNMSKQFFDSALVTRMLHKKMTPDLLVWPETVIPFDVQNSKEQSAQELISAFSIEYKVPIIFGALGIELVDKKTTIRNRAYCYSPEDRDGKNSISVQWYDKEHLVPFGEFLPSICNFSCLRGLLQEVGTFSAGGQHAPLKVKVSIPGQEGKYKEQEDVSVGVLICVEAIFPELARKHVKQGAEFFVAISNDSWFGRSSALQQHLALAQMQTIEMCRWMVRGTTSGISAFIDPYGRIVSTTDIFIPENFIGTVKPLKCKTLFFRIAPVLPWAIGVIFLIMIWNVKKIKIRMFLRRKGF